MIEKKQSKRLIHIDLLNKTLNAQSENISSEQLSSVKKVVQILVFITNAEYSNMHKIYGRKVDDQFFADLTEFLINELLESFLFIKRFLKIDIKKFF